MPNGAWPWVSVGILGVVLLLYLLVRARREVARLTQRLEDASMALQRLQRSFSRFAPEALVERIISSGLPTIGESKEVTVLFADLVGFTTLAESVEPSMLVEIVNGYFERMSRAIAENAGHVSTFIGDGILALFGALEPDPWQGNDAAHAALAMRSALEAYNRELEAKSWPRLAIGIGLHRGTGVAGLVGSETKKEFAIVGRTVNVASRVQEHSRMHRADILLTEDLRKTLDPRFLVRSLPAVTFRGLEKPTPIYALDRFDESP